MAYKIVNDDSLTSVANAIRVQGSISGTLEFPDGFVSAIQNLSPSGNDALVITLTDSAAVSETYGYHWTPDCSYNDYYEAVIQQRPIGLKVNCTICGDAYARRINDSPSRLQYQIVEVVVDANYNAIGLANKSYQFTYNGVTLANEFFTPLPWDATAVTSDVASGKIFYTSNGREVGTATLGSNDFIITASKDGQDNFTIDKTFAEIKSAYQDGKRLVVCSTDYIVAYYEYIDAGSPSNDCFYIVVFTAQNDLVELDYTYYSSRVTSEVGDTYYYPSLENATPSDVASGKTFINWGGRQTGTATPPSGTYSITSNGIYDIVSFASVDVNVSGGGGGDHDAEAGIIQRTISGSYYNSVATIVGTYAFTSCTSLTEARFPIASRVSASAFFSCTQLKKVVLDEANFVGNYAFNNCRALMSVVLLSSAVASLPYTAAFNYTPMSNSTYTGSFGSIYVPASLVDSYKSAKNWSAYAERITSYVE